MSAPEKIWANPYYGMLPNQVSGIWKTENPFDRGTEYTRTDLSQAAVAAALEAAAVKSDDMATEWGKKREAAWRKKNATEEARVFDGMSLAALTVADAIRALITDRDRDALAAHGAAEVAKARAEDAAWLPVEDAPQDGTAVITIKSNGDVARGAWYQNPFGDENTFIDRASGKWWTAVGWLPMPKALTQIGAKP